MDLKKHILWLIAMFCLLSCISRDAEYYYRSGRALRESGQPIEAMQAFSAATRCHTCEYAVKGRAYSNMATMCRIGERHDLAYALYEQSAIQFVDSKDMKAYAFALNNMAWEQAVLGNKEKAIQLADSALACYPDDAVCLKISESRAAACLYAEEYDSVLYYTQQMPLNSVYFDILRAQAFTFLGNNDSAIYYAKRVLQKTTNPRYLDDAYYILTHCDRTADADDIRGLAVTRSDIQYNLERNDPEWIIAIQMAEQALEAQNPKQKRIWFCGLIAIFILFGAILACWLYFRRKRINSVEQQCLQLKKSPNLREELHWNDYAQFSAACNARLNGIVDKLDKKGLSEREIRISVLILIGFTYAEMAEILFRAESGIGKDKYIIAKRLGVSVKELHKTLQTITCDRYA